MLDVDDVEIVDDYVDVDGTKFNTLLRRDKSLPQLMWCDVDIFMTRTASLISTALENTDKDIICYDSLFFFLATICNDSPFHNSPPAPLSVS